ncbi:MAG: AGE family epimerase/isomerase [Alphaproteobacteria bacterium]|nr:AGE family epimerase/isomerase [Alphaproteobacteria bacterium]
MSITSDRIRTWLCESALPLWSGEGFDHEEGGFFDNLSISGVSIRNAPKRLRVQARQIYVFSHAHILGWKPESTEILPLEAARNGFEFMTDNFWRENLGGFIYSTDKSGRIHEPRVELYDQAFVLLACAWYYRASRDKKAITTSENVLKFIDSNLMDKDYGGYFENLSHDLPRRQNPHMHLLEALLALYDSIGNEQYLSRAENIIELFYKYFFNKETGTIGEFFDAAWRPAEGTVGQIVEPGHLYEWIWLLNKYSSFTSANCAKDMNLIYDFAEKHGVNNKPGPTRGLVHDAVLSRGAELDENKRLWRQTEAIKAHIALLECDNNIEVYSRLEKLLDCIFKFYIPMDKGVWHEHLNQDGQLIRDNVPATSLYHLFLALTEVLRVRDRITAL